MRPSLTRQELLIAIEMGRDVVPGEIGLSWILVAPNPHLSRRVGKSVVRECIIDGVVVVVEEFGQLRLRITPKGRSEANGEQTSNGTGEEPGLA